MLSARLEFRAVPIKSDSFEGIADACQVVLVAITLGVERCMSILLGSETGEERRMVDCRVLVSVGSVIVPCCGRTTVVFEF